MITKDFKKLITVISTLGIIFTCVLFAFDIKCGIIGVLFLSATLSTTIYFNRKRSRKLEELNKYLDMVCMGNYDFDISSNSEGEISILQNNLYKVVVMLKSTNEELEKDKHFLAESMADISHQLKTPLTSMMVMSDLLKNEQDDEKRKQFIGIIESQLNKMKWLISNLLKLSRLDAGAADFSIKELSISTVIEESLKPLMLLTDLKNITINNNFRDFKFKGDFNWSVEAVQNIIKNCIEHSNDGGSITINTENTTIYSQLSISDNGCGIDETDLPHIFERFYRGKNSDSESIGIGLALTKEILAKENAKISVESSKNNGTTFNIKFYKAII